MRRKMTVIHRHIIIMRNIHRTHLEKCRARTAEDSAGGMVHAEADADFDDNGSSAIGWNVDDNRVKNGEVKALFLSARFEEQRAILVPKWVEIGVTLHETGVTLLEKLCKHRKHHSAQKVSKKTVRDYVNKPANGWKMNCLNMASYLHSSSRKTCCSTEIPPISAEQCWSILTNTQI